MPKSYASPAQWLSSNQPISKSTGPFSLPTRALWREKQFFPFFLQPFWNFFLLFLGMEASFLSLLMSRGEVFFYPSDCSSFVQKVFKLVNIYGRGVSIWFFGKWKTNKMSKTSVLISNLWSILCFSRWCVLRGKRGLDLFKVLTRSTGTIIQNYFQHYYEIILIVVI